MAVHVTVVLPIEKELDPEAGLHTTLGDTPLLSEAEGVDQDALPFGESALVLTEISDGQAPITGF